jgi:hypothetical protein
MKKDNLFFGCLLGLVAPIIAFIMSQFNLTGIDIGNKTLSFYVIAALINLLLMRYYYRNGMGNSARGIILITFIGAMAMLFFREVNVGE